MSLFNRAFVLFIMWLVSAATGYAVSISDIAREFQNKEIDVDSLFNYIEGKNHSGEVYWWALHNSEKNDSFASYILGRCYLDGIGTDKDEAKALDLFERAASQGVSEALADLGLIYINGLGVEKDIAKAVQYLEQASNKNIARATDYLGWTYMNKKDYSRAYDLYKRAADAGYSGALNHLGHLYEKGYGVDRDLTKAFEYYMEAAKKGNKYGLYNVGRMYEYGLGVNQNYEKSFDYYLASAERGNEYSQYKVGYFYQYGYVKNEVSFNQIANWYELSASRGYIPARVELAFLYLDGNGVPENKTKAIEIIESTDTDYIGALGAYRVAQYYNETGNPSKVLYWAKLAYDITDLDDEVVHPDACALLGITYLKGGKEVYDYPSAIKYLREAAESGRVDCERLLESLGEPID